MPEEENQNVENELKNVIDTVENAKNKTKEISETQEKLMQANQKLVEIVLTMEEVMVKNGITLDEYEGHDYNFEGGWQSGEEKHKEKLRLEEHVESDAILEQIREVEHLLGELEIYK